MKKKKFIITIDTEGDNMWRRLYTPNAINRITNRNGEFLYRFQELCEKYEFIPTYLVDYEMSLSGPFVEMSREKLKTKKLEIGMHMHSWTCPPFYELKRGRTTGGENPYIYEYPTDVITKKVDYITKHLEDVFQTDILSHRSGRWAMDERYLNILKEYGYVVDCSITPGVDWSTGCGLTEGSKGSNYKGFLNRDYEVDLSNIKRKGKSGFYEVPVTIGSKRCGIFKKQMVWLRPNGRNIKEMCALIMEKEKSNVDYVEFMLHSSELMPGGSPVFKTEKSIEKLYQDMDLLFHYASIMYSGISLSNFVVKKYRGNHTNK